METRMKRKRVGILELGAVLFIVAVLGALAMSNGCGLIAGAGRDLTAMADGMAGDSADNARAIRGKGE